jgi:hypothetical protein
MWSKISETLSKIADWGWLILVFIGAFSGDFRWYGVAMLWGGGRLMVQKIRANKVVTSAITSQTTGRDLVTERAQESVELDKLATVTSIVLVLGGFVFTSIFDEYKGMKRDLVELCEDSEQVDWDSQARMGQAFNETCAWTERSYSD